MNTATRFEIIKAIRDEISKYFEGEFTDHDHLIEDMHILSDDLTAIALGVERSLNIKVPRERYRSVISVETFADAVQELGLR